MGEIVGSSSSDSNLCFRQLNGPAFIRRCTGARIQDCQEISFLTHKVFSVLIPGCPAKLNFGLSIEFRFHNGHLRVYHVFPQNFAMPADPLDRGSLLGELFHIRFQERSRICLNCASSSVN